MLKKLVILVILKLTAIENQEVTLKLYGPTDSVLKKLYGSYIGF
jgi:hypothetical protein